MGEILDLLNSFREGSLYPLALPYLKVAALLIVGAGAGVAMTVRCDDALADVRTALRQAGITDKEAAGYFGGSIGNFSDRMTGERSLTIQKLASLPAEFWRWWAVATAVRHGLPVPVTVGARLARRQARMSMPQSQKVGVA